MAVTVVNEALADGMAVELWFTDDLLDSWNVATPTTDGVPNGVFDWRPSAELVVGLSDLLDGSAGTGST